MSLYNAGQWDAAVSLSLKDLQERVAELEKQVAAMKAVNDAPAQTPADLRLGADVKAVQPAYLKNSDAGQIMRMRGFIMDILDSEMYGHAVSREVRNAARRALGLDFKE